MGGELVDCLRNPSLELLVHLLLFGESLDDLGVTGFEEFVQFLLVRRNVGLLHIIEVPVGTGEQNQHLPLNRQRLVLGAA